jgi:hypothetical protein
MPAGEQFKCPRNDAIMHCGFEKHTPVTATSGKAVSTVFFTEKLRVTDNGEERRFWFVTGEHLNITFFNIRCLS